MTVGAGDAPELRIEVLGRIRAWLGDQELTVGPPRRQAVLSALVLRANRTVSRDQIVDAVWGDDPPASAVNAVHVHVAALRRTFEPGRDRRRPGRILTGDTAGYLLRLTHGQLDLDELGGHLDRARQLSASGNAAAAVAAFDAALALWHGTPLAGVSGPAANAERNRLEEVRLEAVQDRADVMLRSGRHAELVADLVALSGEYPLRERLRALLMSALYQCGRQADALSVYSDTRRLLVEELGVEPGPELQRLQQVILAREPMQLARDADVPRYGTNERITPRQLPPAARHFTGRAAELTALTTHLERVVEPGCAVVISALDGTAGIGKTTLAVHWAHHAAHHFPDGQLYVNLRGFGPTALPVAPAEAVRGFLDALQVPPERFPSTPDAQEALYRSLLADRRMLVVLDNAATVEQVRPLLPGSPGCFVLVTSRNQLAGLVASHGAHSLTLDTMPAAEANELLSRHLGGARVAAEPTAAEEIVLYCAGLPLALAVVAARAASRPSFPLAVLAAELREARGGLDAFDVGDLGSDVRAVFSWSYRTLSGDAARLFRLLGLHPGQDISLSAAASLVGLPTPRVRVLVAELTRAHLVGEQRPGRYTLHDLIRSYSAELVRDIETEADRRAALHRMLDHYVHAACAAARAIEPNRSPIPLAPAQPGVIPAGAFDGAQALDWFAAERAVLVAVARLAADQGLDTHAWQLPWALAGFLEGQGNWQDICVLESVALAAARRLGEPLQQAGTHRGLGSAYTMLRRFSDAEEQFEIALELCRSQSDPRGEANTRLRLAWLHDTREQRADALAHTEQALELFGVCGDHRGAANALNGIGWYQLHLGDPGRALASCRRALALLQDFGDRLGEADTWDSLGLIHHHLDDHEAAMRCYQRAVDLYRELGSRYREGIVVGRIGDSRHAAGELDGARDAWQEALAILDPLGHPATDGIRARLDELNHVG